MKTYMRFRSGWLIRLLATVVAVIGVTAQGQVLMITVGNHDLLPDTPNQPVTLFVSNPGGAIDITGLTLYAVIADGGPELDLSLADGPSITGVDLISGTAFAANNTGNNPAPGSLPQFVVYSTTTDAGTVSLGTGDSLMATLTVDTTGFFGGVFSLKVSDLDAPLTPLGSYQTIFNNSVGGEIFPTTIDGTITIVPEPGSVGLAAGLLLVGWLGWRRIQA